MINIQVNSCNTPIENLNLDALPQEIQEEFYDCINNIPYIKRLISLERCRAKDLPRDNEGKIIVDITKPHILEDTDYFRPSAIKFQKDGRYTDLRPNRNPNSEFYKWASEEIRRCFEGYVRPSDGEWITGDMYFFLNYCPIQILKKDAKGKNIRTIGFPAFWEGHYYKAHYLEQCRIEGNHAMELASRGKGKSYWGAAMLAKRFIFGESREVKEKVQSVVTASERKYIQGANQILDMFQYYIDFNAQNCPWPHSRITDSIQGLQWTMGYKDKTGIRRGSQNSVMGITSKDDESKLRGSRGVLYLLEEAGSFPRLLNLYQVLRPSVEDGNDTWGLIYGYGTSGDNESDFSSMQELMYNSKGYKIKGVDNIYDKEGQGRKFFTYFFPGYINRANCYDAQGNSDVTKAVLEILKDRYTVKYNTTDINAITKRIAEIPITPQEAILKAKGSIFPITQLNERLVQIDNNPNEFDEVLCGSLIMEKDGTVKYQLTNDLPIRDFPLKDNTARGSIEIYQMPEKDREGKVNPMRYIGGFDPYDNDQAESMSLGSFFILDLFTDKIVFEYTGRTMYAEELYEIVRLGCIFYNCKCLYEAHPHSQKVKLPSGETKLWKDIKVGDELLAPNGRTVKVIDIPVDKYMPIYKVTLKDGRTVMCNDGHLWQVYEGGYKQRMRLLTTRQLINIGVKNKYGNTNFFIPNAGIINYPHQDVPIDPYTMGLLIAEGAFTKFRKNKIRKCAKKIVQISASKEDMEFYKKHIPYQVKYIGTKGYSWHLFINNIDTILQSLDLLCKDSYTKHIPDIYLYNDYNTRLELLQGLMDGDGCAKTGGAPVYITASEQLSLDLQTLCRSLGMNCNCYKNESSYVNRKGFKSYHFRINIFANQCVFKLPRKANIQHIYNPSSKGSKANSLILRTAIESIEFSHYEMGKCVTVDSNDGLYLIGDYVVTHNCNKKGTFAYFSKMNCTHLLADTPEYLRDKQLIKYSSFGSSSKGVNASNAINNYANALIKDWLLQPVPQIIKEGNEEKQIEVPNLYFIKNRALIKELILYNPMINVDRIRALGMVMLYREEKRILFQGDMERTKDTLLDVNYKGNDSFFNDNYDVKFKSNINEFQREYS